MRLIFALSFLTLVLAPVGLCQDDADHQYESPLAQEVTIRTRGVTLPDLCDELTGQTGVKYKVSRELANERLTVMAADVPLGKLHRLIADLFRVHVSRNDTAKGETRYEFWRDAKGREAEAILVRQAWSMIARQFAEQAEKGEPTYKPSHDYVTPMLRILAELGYKQIYRVVENKSVSIPYAMLTLTQRNALIDVYEQRELSLEKSMRGDEEEGFFPIRRPPFSSEEIERSPLKLRVHMDLFSGRAMLVPASIGKFYRSRFVLCDVRLRETAYLPARGCPYAKDDRTAPADGSLPALEKAVELPRDAGWEGALEKLHEATKLTIVSDYYLPLWGGSYQRHLMPARIGPASDSGSTSLAEGLDALCKATDHLWWELDGSCLFRTQLWYIKRLYEVPKELLESWRKTVKKNGKLGKAEIDQVAQLTARQIEGLSSSWGWTHFLQAADFCEAIKLYQMLNSFNREKVLTGGLAFADMGPIQQSALSRIVYDRFPITPPESVTNSKFILHQGPFRRECRIYAWAMRPGDAQMIFFWVRLGGKETRRISIGSLPIPYLTQEEWEKKQALESKDSNERPPESGRRAD